MSYQFPLSIQSIVDQKMATGLYASEDEVLLKALGALDDFEQSVADLRESMEDELAGRTISLADADREIRRELGFST